MTNDHLLVIDTDWASDPIIAEVSDYLMENKIKTTWFVTHASPEIKKLSKSPDIFEVGIHPNFAENSSQGRCPREIMKSLLKIASGAKSIRTHNLMQSTPLLKMMREEFGIQYETSMVLRDTPDIVPHKLYFSKDKWLLRFPCFWEDDLEMCVPNPSFSITDKKYQVPGMKIFAFHPIHIVLNSKTLKNYIQCKSEVDITKCSLSDLIKYKNASSNGAGTFFREIAQLIKNSSRFPGMTISGIAKEWGAMK